VQDASHDGVGVTLLERFEVGHDAGA
jgi:hypothetical protein